MTLQNRITAIDILITAAQVRLQIGDAFTSMQLLQDARIIAVMNDKFLKQQEKHINNALAMAHNVIENYQKEMQENESRQGTNDNRSVTIDQTFVDAITRNEDGTEKSVSTTD